MPGCRHRHPILSVSHPDSASGESPNDGDHLVYDVADGLWHPEAAAGGVTDHDLLDNLAFAVAGHTGFVATGGVAGGQLIKGGVAASENLTLESTAHATKGLIKAKDVIQMANTTAANTRVCGALSAALHYIELGYVGPLKLYSALSGGVNVLSKLLCDSDVRIDGSISLRGTLSQPSYLIDASFNAGIQTGAWRVLDAALTVQAGANGTQLLGVHANPMSLSPSTFTGLLLQGLKFTIQVGTGDSGSSVTTCDTIYTRLMISAFDGTIPVFHGYHLDVMSVTNPGANQSIGHYFGALLAAPGYTKVVDYTGLAIPDETDASGTILLAEIGPATPYLRVLGGGDPAANQSNILIKLGATLKQVTEDGVNSAGAGYRALRVPN